MDYFRREVGAELRLPLLRDLLELQKDCYQDAVDEVSHRPLLEPR